jgi:glutamate/tyrosine decarboxylase-like PLP-dependent enzyme
MLGIGARELVRVAVDSQGRMRADELARALAASPVPTIVCAQAGNVATGASDPFEAIVDVAHRHGAWVHVDGAFGLWAAAVPSLAGHVRGLARADSWTTDAHKWLNVPYDSGIAICAHPAPHRAAMSVHASYLERGEDEQRIGMDWVPESSRRGRVVPLYALIRTLGRTGIQSMIARTCALARRMVERLEHADGVRILNDIVLNQVLVRFGGQNDDSAESRSAGDQRTRAVIARVQSDGTCWAGGAVWQGRQVMRISISNWSTTEQDIDRSAEAILRCWLSEAAAPPARSS